jgi:aminoglycoside phosphotransferase (APT) family kinase protein
VRPPGRLLASGRDADIFEYGPGLVLRRSRAGTSMLAEARIMQHVRAQGYPVPAVEEVSQDGTDIVMERVDGPSMVAALGRRPWTVSRQGRVLAELHRRLHEIAGPDWLPAAPVGVGDRLIHLDLHPLNVIVGRKGPVVIDWTNAARGPAAVDVGLTWVLMAAGEIPTSRIQGALMGRARSLLVNSFLSHVDVADAEALLRQVVRWKVQDPHMSPDEQQAMWRVVQRMETSR